MGAEAIPLVGSVFSAANQINEANERKWQMEEEARSAERNAILARKAGQYNAERQQIIGEKTVGAIRADYGASGVSLDSASVLDVIRESVTNSELDRQNILFGAEMKAVDYEQRARAARIGGENALRAGRTDAFATMFKAGGDYAVKAYSGKTTQSRPSGAYSSDFRQGNLRADSYYG